MLRIGDRRFCACTGWWREMIIERVNEDASFDVRLDEPPKRFPPPTWHGVTRGELVETATGQHEAERPVPLYWNQVRMGGRDPTEVARPITVIDACAALGIMDTGRVDASAAITRVERRLGVRVPDELRQLMDCAGLADAVIRGHPNSPHLLATAAWGRCDDDDGPVLVFMESYTGDVQWGVALPPRPPQVFLLPDEDVALRLTAPSVSFFLWDLCQTGLVWHQSTGAGEQHPLRRTTVGVAPDQRSWWSRLWGR